MLIQIFNKNSIFIHWRIHSTSHFIFSVSGSIILAGVILKLGGYVHHSSLPKYKVIINLNYEKLDISEKMLKNEVKLKKEKGVWLSWIAWVQTKKEEE